MTTGDKASYLLAFSIPDALTQRLNEAARGCLHEYGVYPMPGLLGYFVGVTPPFMLRDGESIEGLTHALGPETTGMRAVEMPVELGELSEPLRTLYFGGKEPVILAVIEALRSICSGFAEPDSFSGSNEIMPCCVLYSVGPDMNDDCFDLCKGIFDDVPFPEVLYLDTLVVYRDVEGLWEEEWRITLGPDA
jgi:hypothetical protein